MKKNNKTFYIFFIVLVLFGISIGYAVINRTLNITGNSEVKQNTWDIHFENVRVVSGSVEAIKEPTIENSNTSVNFSFMLDLPGDYYEFTVDAVNKGTINAMIESITKTPELTTEQAKYLNYIIEYQNGEQIVSKQSVKNGEFVRIKVRVEYRTDITEFELPTTSQSLNLGFTVNYVQSDNTGSVVVDNGVAKVKPTANGSLDDIGTIVTIGDQQFYTIGTEGDNVKLLSMYNLHVGNQYDNGVVLLANPTGKQSETAKGWFSGYSATNPIIGATAFSNTNSTYAGSIVEGYVNNYKTILESDYDVDIVEARLITKEELTSEEIGCSEESETCSNAPSFIYSTTYWSGSADITGFVWFVASDGSFIGDIYSNDGLIGVRPVVIISKSLF